MNHRRDTPRAPSGRWRRSSARAHSTTAEPPHLGIRGARRSGLDRSLDRRHLDIHYAPNPALENPAGDRAHGAREVDLNPHLGVGLPIAHRLKLHPPPRRGSAHRPGERQAAGRLDSGHVLGPVASGPEYPLRPLLHPRAGLKRSTLRQPSIREPLAPTPASVQRRRDTPRLQGTLPAIVRRLSDLIAIARTLC